MDYYVVLFDEYTSMVPETWLNMEEQTIAWPPGPITHSRMQNLSPTVNWMEYKYKKIMGPFDYLKAQQVEKQTMNCSTEEDTDAIITASQRKTVYEKRQRKRKQLSLDETDDEFAEDMDEVSDENLTHSKKYQPSIKARKKNISYSHLKLPKGPSIGLVSEASKDTAPLAKSTFNSTSSNIMDVIHDNTPADRDKEKENVSNAKQPLTLRRMKEFTKSVVKANQIRKLLEEEIRKNNADEESDENEEFFPLSTVEDLEKFNNILINDSIARKKFKCMVQKIDGHNLTSHTNETLRRVIADDLAIMYSYSGQTRGKKRQYKTLPFKNLKLFKVLRDAIVSSRVNYTEREFIEVVKRFLNCAKYRIEKKAIDDGVFKVD